MKIAFINQPQDGIAADEEQHGSVAIVQWELARELSSRHDITVYAPLHQGQYVSDGWEGIKIRRIPCVARTFHKGFQLLQGAIVPDQPYFASRLYFREYFWQLARALRKDAPEVIHVPQQFQFAVLLRRAVPSAKIVLHMHQDDLAMLERQSVLHGLRCVDGVVTVSNFIAERIRRRFPEHAERVSIIGNGVDVQRFRPGKREGETSSPSRLLFVGRVSPDKGVHLLVEAFDVLARERPDLELTLVGKAGLLPFDVLRLLLKDDPALDTLRVFYGRSIFDWFMKVVWGQHSSYPRALMEKVSSESATRIHFAGTVPLPQLLNHYQAADVLVLPSVWHESYGLPVAEAMSSGVPVVASRCGGLPELIDDGVTGRLVPRCDLNALIATLRTVLADRERARAMGRAARTRAERLLTWKRSAATLEKVYEGLIAKGRGNVGHHREVRATTVVSAARVAPR